MNLITFRKVRSVVLVVYVSMTPHLVGPNKFIEVRLELPVLLFQSSPFKFLDWVFSPHVQVEALISKL